MSERQLSYQELAARLAEAEAVLSALRSGAVDAVISEEDVLLVRARKVEERLEHLGQALRAARRVGQVLLREQDTNRLLRGVCQGLVESGAYHSAWIALLDEEGRARQMAQTGLGDSFAPLARMLQQGEMPDCGRRALNQNGVVAVIEPTTPCANCPLIMLCGQHSMLLAPVRHGQQLYGLLAVFTPRGFGVHEEEQTLFGQIAGDIAFALHDREAEKQRDLAQAELKDSLKEKEILIRELYHRTKNNMQVISSMLALQAEFIDNPEVHKVFREIDQRIRSMALVHEKLYRSRDLSRLSLDEYVVDLAYLLLRSYRLTPDRVALVFDVEPVSALIDIALPCGLILNELIANALEHAFPGERQGELRIGLHRTDEGEITMEVADNGVGMPAGFDFEHPTTFGLHIVQAIARHQLQGEITFVADEGLKCRVRFRDDLYRERV